MAYIPQFNKFIVYPKGTAGDKNNHIEIEMQNLELALEISEERYQFDKFKNLVNLKI